MTKESFVIFHVFVRLNYKGLIFIWYRDELNMGWDSYSFGSPRKGFGYFPHWYLHGCGVYWHSLKCPLRSKKDPQIFGLSSQKLFYIWQLNLFPMYFCLLYKNNKHKALKKKPQKTGILGSQIGVFERALKEIESQGNHSVGH